MDLFDDQQNPSHNWLPYDGEVYYYGAIMSLAEADKYLQQLTSGLDWQADQVKMMGRLITTRRLVAWYASQTLSYTYAGITKTPLPWNEPLLRLKQLIEACSDSTFNACLANFYHDGHDAMGYHCDNEKDLQPEAAIASLSLGAPRRFCFKHRHTKAKVELNLAHGSLLVMQGDIQKYWLHALPATKKVDQTRVNLTFRSMQTR